MVVSYDNVMELSWNCHRFVMALSWGSGLAGEGQGAGDFSFLNFRIFPEKGNPPPAAGDF